MKTLERGTAHAARASRSTGAIRPCVLLTVSLFLTASCSLGGWRPRTTYLESPYAPKAIDTVAPVAVGCLSVEEIEGMLGANGLHADLPWLIYDPQAQERGDPAKHGSYVAKLIEVIKTSLSKPPFEDVGCPDGRSTGDPATLIAKLVEQAETDHRGLKLMRVNTGAGVERRVRENRREIFEGRLGTLDTVSMAYERPASLAMSARTVEGASAPSSAFTRLSERGQAAMLGFLEQFAGKWNDMTPDEVVRRLLSVLAPTEESFSETQRTELTVSAALNTSGVDDRLEYVAAYLVIPPVPGALSAGVHLEARFLGLLRAFSLPHHPHDRKDRVVVNVDRALSRLTVRFTDIDKPQTVVTPLDLGSLQSTIGIAVEAGGAVPAGPTLKATPKLEESRTDKLLKEIDRRSLWVTPDRTMVRLTQRGHEAITVAGTITQNISVQIPRGELLKLNVKMTEGRAGEQATASVSVSNVSNPLYATVDGFGFLVGVVRIAVPTRYAFSREPNGYAMTVLEGPVRLRVWERRFRAQELMLKQLFPGRFDRRRDLGDLLVVLRVPETSHFAIFESSETKATFLTELGRTIGLKAVPVGGEPADELWLKIVPCARTTSRATSTDRASLFPDDLLLGVEDFDGRHRGFRRNIEIDVSNTTWPYACP